MIPSLLFPVVEKGLAALGLVQRDTFRRPMLDRFIVEHQGMSLPERETTFRHEVLIPCYNHGRFLPGVLESLRDKKVQVTIINDASTDTTAACIAELQRAHVFKLITNEHNLLQFGSLNKAIEQSDSNLFTVLNADDFLLPGWLDYAENVFETTSVSLLGGARINFQGEVGNDVALAKIVRSISYLPTTAPTIYGPSDAVHFSHDNSIDMTMSGCTFLKSSWSFVDGFYPRERRTSLWDDRDFQMRVCAFFEIGISSEISAFYRTNSSLGLGTS